MFSPRSSSAIARSLSRMSVPFTRATTASDPDEDEVAEEEDEFFEQADIAGRTSSASAATAATVIVRGRDALNWEAGASKNFQGIDFSNDVSKVMAAVLGKCAGPPDWRRRTLAQSLSLCNGPIWSDSDDNVSRNGQLTRMYPPLISPQSRPLLQPAGVRVNQARNTPQFRQPGGPCTSRRCRDQNRFLLGRFSRSDLLECRNGIRQGLKDFLHDRRACPQDFWLLERTPHQGLSTARGRDQRA